MKIQTNRESGSALLTVLTTAGIMGIGLASYLSLTSNQSRAITRSQSYNAIIPVSEAGIEEAMSQINVTNNWGGNSWTLVNGMTLSNGVSLTGNYYYKQRTLSSGRYTVAISQSSPPTIYSQGYVVAYPRTNEISRTVRVTTLGGALFSKGLVAKGNVSWSGNIVTDSFDSQDPAHSTNGRYNAATRKDVGSVGSVNGVITMGGGDIYGSAATGPTGSCTGGTVGDAAFIAANSGSAIQSGHYANNMNVSFPDGVLPSDWGAAGGPWTLGSSPHVINTAGDYVISSIANGENMTVNAKVRLYVQGSIAMQGQSVINITTNGSLTMYVGGDCALGGNGVQNATADALKFSLVGLSTCTSVTLHGNASFTGTIYAPSADFDAGGGGNDNYDCVGAVIAKTISMNGHFDFHYDENLGKNGPIKAWSVGSWTEL